LRFCWPDATRDQKHVAPLKTADGWKVLHSNDSNADDNEFHADKSAVTIARSPVAGGNTVKLGPRSRWATSLRPRMAWGCTSPPKAAWPMGGAERACAAAHRTSSTTTTSARGCGPSRAATSGAMPSTRRPPSVNPCGPTNAQAQGAGSAHAARVPSPAEQSGARALPREASGVAGRRRQWTALAEARLGCAVQ
jgi:hypothetical protein